MPDMSEDVNARLRRIEAKLDGLTGVVIAMSIIGLTALLYAFFAGQWGWW